MGTPNWGKLKEQGRVKEVGIPWNDKEAKALADGVPADYVRRGALSVKDYEKMVTDDEKAEAKGTLPVEAMNRAQLEARLKELNVTGYTAQATDDGLRGLVTAAEEEVVEEKPKATKKPAKKAAAKKK